MAIPSEAQAAIIVVAGEWARYLETIEPKNHEVVLKRLIARQKDIIEELKKVHTHFSS